MPRPARALNLSAKLKDSANTEAPQLSFQRKAVQDFHSRNDDKNDPVDPPPSPPSPTVGADTNAPSANVVPTPQSTHTVADSDSNDEGQPTAPCKSSPCTKLDFSLWSFLYSQEKAFYNNHVAGEEKLCNHSR